MDGHTTDMEERRRDNQLLATQSICMQLQAFASKRKQMNTTKKSFMVYIDSKAQIFKLNDTEAGILFKAIIEYADTGKSLDEEELAKKAGAEDIDPRVIDFAFEGYKSQINRDSARYKLICEKRSESAKKKYQQQEPQGEEPENTSADKSKQLDASASKSKQLDASEGDRDRDRDREINKRKKEESSTSPQKPSLEERKEEFKNSITPELVARYGSETCNAFFRYWTEKEAKWQNKTNPKMRFEMQKTWETAKRLATWSSKEGEYTRSR